MSLLASASGLLALATVQQQAMRRRVTTRLQQQRQAVVIAGVVLATGGAAAFAGVLPVVQKRWKAKQKWTPNPERKVFTGSNAVRIILTQDLVDGKRFKNDVIKVPNKRHARAYLRKKVALYATPENFKRLGLVDPLLETAMERRMRLLRYAAAAKERHDRDLKLADDLKQYLSTKTLKMWLRIDDSVQENEEIPPAIVVARQIPNTLSRQLKIDLEGHEKVHLVPTPVRHKELTDKDIAELFKGLPDPSKRCYNEVTALGQYLARISLRGGFSVPLKIKVCKCNKSGAESVE